MFHHQDGLRLEKLGLSIRALDLDKDGDFGGALGGVPDERSIFSNASGLPTVICSASFQDPTL